MNRKITAAILAMATALGLLTSCSSVQNTTENSSELTSGEFAVDDARVPEQLTDPVLLSKSFKKTRLPVSDKLNGSLEMFRMGGTGDVVAKVYDYTTYKTVYYRLNDDLTDCEKIALELPETVENADYYRADTAFSADGSSITYYTMEDHGGIKAPEEFDEGFDYESFYANYTTSYGFAYNDPSGSLTDFTLTEFPEDVINPEYGGPTVYSLLVDGDELLFVTVNGMIYKKPKNGDLVKISEGREPAPAEESGYGEDYVRRDASEVYGDLFRGSDGGIFAVLRESTEVYNGIYVNSEITCEYSRLTDSGISAPFYQTKDQDEFEGRTSFLCGGRGDILFYVNTIRNGTGMVTGIRADGSEEEVLDWSASDTEPMGLLTYGENEFIAYDEEMVGNDFEMRCNIYLMTPKTAEELADTKVITVGIPFIGETFPGINEFNESQSDYRVKLVDYTPEDYDPAHFYTTDMKLTTDILTGNAPDVIIGLDIPSFRNFSQKGVFADLYEFMDRDERVNRSTVLPNVLRSMESSDGSLYGIYSGFGVKTIVTKDSVWNKENWTLDEMIGLYENAPETAIHKYDSISKLDMFNMMASSMNELIDYETAACNFEDPSFKRMLEFCKNFVDDPEQPDKSNDYEYQTYWEDKWSWFSSEKVLIEETDPTSYNMLKVITSGGADMTFAGYPSSDGHGGLIEPVMLMAITENSSEKDGAWAFISYLLENHDRGIGVTEVSFKKDIDSITSKGGTASGTPFPPFTAEEAERLEKYIRGCDTLALILDEDVSRVCEEEAMLYFGNVQTVEETMEHIQNRVSIIISEKS